MTAASGLTIVIKLGAGIHIRHAKEAKRDKASS